MSQNSRRGWVARAVLAGTVALTTHGSATAEPVVADRTSYLRDGPGVRFRPVDEVLGGSSVDLLACEAGWCRIRFGDAVGYVPDGVLRRGPAPAGIGSATTCFLNPQTGYHGTRDVQFCSPVASP